MMTILQNRMSSAYIDTPNLRVLCIVDNLLDIFCLNMLAFIHTNKAGIVKILINDEGMRGECAREEWYGMLEVGV